MDPTLFQDVKIHLSTNMRQHYNMAHIVQLAKKPQSSFKSRFAPSVKTEGGNYHVIDVNVYLGKQRAEEIGMLVILRNFILLSAPRQKYFVCNSTTD